MELVDVDDDLKSKTVDFYLNFYEKSFENLENWKL